MQREPRALRTVYCVYSTRGGGWGDGESSSLIVYYDSASRVGSTFAEQRYVPRDTCVSPNHHHHCACSPHFPFLACFAFPVPMRSPFLSSLLSTARPVHIHVQPPYQNSSRGPHAYSIRTLTHSLTPRCTPHRQPLVSFLPSFYNSSLPSFRPPRHSPENPLHPRFQPEHDHDDENG